MPKKVEEKSDSGKSDFLSDFFLHFENKKLYTREVAKNNRLPRLRQPAFMTNQIINPSLERLIGLVHDIFVDDVDIVLVIGSDCDVVAYLA